MTRIVFLTAILMLTGCGSDPLGRQWLIKAGDQTVTVSELGNAWNELDSITMADYLQEENVVAAFVTGYGRKMLILQAIDSPDYLHSPEIHSHMETWLRNTSYSAFCDSLFYAALDTLSPELVTEVSGFIGTAALFHEADGEVQGPAELQDLNIGLARALYHMQPGESCQIDGVTWYLDSLIVMPQEELAVYFPDRAAIEDYAASAIASRAVTREVERLTDPVRLSFQADTTLLSSWPWEVSEPSPDHVISSWDGGEFRVRDLPGMLMLSSVSGGHVPHSEGWFLVNLLNNAMMVRIEEIYSASYPADHQSIAERAETMARIRASDLLFENEVVSRVTITESTLLEEFRNLDSIPEIPETRIFESVILDSDNLPEVLELSGSQPSPEAFGLPPYPVFLPETGGFASRPVTYDELPLKLDEAVFSVDASDTLWQGPILLGNGSRVLFRVVQVIPPHTAEFDEIREDLERIVRSRIEEQYTLSWFIQLEETYGLEINSSILEDLPADPGIWSDL